MTDTREVQLLIRLNAREDRRIRKRHQDEGQGLGLSTWARQELMGREQKGIIRRLVDIGILNEEDPTIRKLLTDKGEF